MRRLPKLSAEELAEARKTPLKRYTPKMERQEAGLKGRSYGDCVTRAISGATGLSYVDVRIALQDAQADFAETPLEGKSRAEFWAKLRAGEKSHIVQRGVHKAVYAPLLEALGLVYTPTPTHRTTVAEPCIPPTAILEMPRHLAAKVDGAIVDTWDCRSRRIEGFWHDPSRFSVDYDNASWQAL